MMFDRSELYVLLFYYCLTTGIWTLFPSIDDWLEVAEENYMSKLSHRNMVSINVEKTINQPAGINEFMVSASSDKTSC